MPARFAAVVAVLLMACAPIRPAISVDRPWQRAESTHFVVESNRRDAADLKRLAINLEAVLHAFAKIPVLGLRLPRQKTLVVALNRWREYRWYARETSAGSFYAKTPMGPMIVVPMGLSVYRSAILKHELAHLILHAHLQHTPDWLDEGLACVMETARINRRDGTVVFGGPNLHRLEAARYVRQVPLPKLIGEWPPKRRRKLYGASWLLVQYMMEHHLAAFLNFQAKLTKGLPWTQAWALEMQVPLVDMTSPLRDYLDRGRFQTWTVRTNAGAIEPPAITSVSPADTYALRATLAMLSGRPSVTEQQRRQAATEDMTRALHIAPDNVRAARVAAALKTSIKLEPEPWP